MRYNVDITADLDSVANWPGQTVIPLWESEKETVEISTSLNEISSVIIPPSHLQEAVLCAPVYMSQDSLLASTEKLSGEVQALTEPKLTYGLYLKTTGITPLPDDNLDFFISISSLRRALPLLPNAFTVIIAGVVRFMGDVLRYLVALKNGQLRLSFCLRRKLTGIVKALHKPLQVIPKSVHPIEAAA